MNVFGVKQANEKDTDLICKMEKACFSDPWSNETVNQMLSTPFIKVFYDIDASNGNPASYLVISKTDCVEILKIGVMPEYRRKKLGTALIEHASTAAEDCPDKKIILEVRQSNTGAIAFYENHGFKTDGIRKNYYKNPTENAILMSLDLNERQ